MPVALPSAGIANASPRFVDFGGILSGELGGDDQRLDRGGSRWAADFVTKPMKGDEARIWIARLVRGMREKASIKFPQPGVPFPTASTAVAATASANAEVIQLQAGTYREGMFMSLIVGGKSSIYQITTDGTALVGIQPPLKNDIPSLAPVALAQARIEGYVQGNQSAWTIDAAKIYGLSFTIVEAR